jgi:hypothetical protein
MLARRGLLLGLLATSGAAMATGLALPAPPELAADLPGATWRGAAVMRFLGLAVYDIRLWSPDAVVGDGAAQPLALELVYARALPGARIASRSIEEMRRIGPVSALQSASWLPALERLFPDVQAGDRLTGVQRPGQSTRFFFNGQRRGELADAEFTRLFFGIWLSPQTSETRLRKQLLGGTA